VSTAGGAAAADGSLGGAAPEGFEEFFLAYFPLVCRYLLWREKDRFSIEDAAQAAMISAYEYWGKVAVMEDPRGWLFKVANQRLSAVQRERGRHTASVTEDTVRADDDITACDRRLDVLRAVQQLPERQREALVLQMQFGLGVAEIAREMSVTTGTVRSHLHLARRGLRDLLDSAEEEVQA
jgi:RNA polymerase sigma-70 factor (ECF subfamily)